MDKKKPQNTSLLARKVAARCIEQVIIHKRGMDLFFAKDTEFLALSSQDRAFCQRLVRLTLRHLGELEQVFKPYFERPLPKNNYMVLAHIYLAAAQMAYANIPAYAAINSAVELVKQQYPKLEKLANAMLRRWLREHDGQVPVKLKANIPDWLYRKWQANYGDELGDMLEVFTQEAPLDLSFKSTDIRGRLLDTLGNKALPLGDSVRVFKKVAVTELPEYDVGNWWVQDVAASLPIYLLGDTKGLQVLDMCSAPGGKAMQLAARGAKIMALDSQQKRIEVMQENIKRVGLDIQLECQDALSHQPNQLYDAILLDAPCSATGTIRRNPDVKYIRTAKNLLKAVDKQKKLLSKGLELLKPGGRLVYCVCSMEKEEGEDIIEALLNERKDIMLANDASLLPVEVLDSGGLGFRTHPGMLKEHGGMDGFFMTSIVKPHYS